MIAALILIVHFCAAVYAFVNYRKEGNGEGFLAVAFVVIIFSVGWTITTMASRFVFPTTLVSQWVAHLQSSPLSRTIAKELTVDTFSLLLLTLGEAVFYYFYLQAGEVKEKTNRQEGRG